MNKTIAVIAILLTIYSTNAQKTNKKDKPYDRWSIEANTGNNKPVEPFSPHYFTSGDNVVLNAPRFNHFDIGVRHMFNCEFGLKFDIAIDDIKNQDGTDSEKFHTRQNRIGIQGIVNLGRLMKFESFTSSWSFLAHGGIQASIFDFGPNSELNGGFLVGISPMLRVGKHFGILADFSVLSNVRQHYTWDGHPIEGTDNLSGKMYYTTVGLAWYIGKKAKHADWYIEPEHIEKENFKGFGQKQHINVFYYVNKDEPTEASAKNIFYAINFLKTFAGTKVIISGYSNTAEEKDIDLALQRVKNLKGIFMANEIDEERVSIVTNEEDRDMNGLEEDEIIQNERKVSITLISIKS